MIKPMRPEYVAHPEIVSRGSSMAPREPIIDTTRAGLTTIGGQAVRIRQHIGCSSAPWIYELLDIRQTAPVVVASWCSRPSDDDCRSTMQRHVHGSSPVTMATATEKQRAAARRGALAQQRTLATRRAMQLEAA